VKLYSKSAPNPQNSIPERSTHHPKRKSKSIPATAGENSDSSDPSSKTITGQKYTKEVISSGQD